MTLRGIPTGTPKRVREDLSNPMATCKISFAREISVHALSVEVTVQTYDTETCMEEGANPVHNAGVRAVVSSPDIVTPPSHFTLLHDYYLFCYFYC